MKTYTRALVTATTMTALQSAPLYVKPDLWMLHALMSGLLEIWVHQLKDCRGPNLISIFKPAPTLTIKVYFMSLSSSFNFKHINLLLKVYYFFNFFQYLIHAQLHVRRRLLHQLALLGTRRSLELCMLTPPLETTSSASNKQMF